MNQKLLIIEPHCDDAFLSLGWHIKKLWKDYEITILTVFGDANRDKEAKKYADSVGATSICLSLPESKMLSKDSKTKLIGPLQALLSTLDRDPKWYNELYRVIFPIGLQHPDHRSVAYTCRSTPLLSVKWAYLDCPYASKLKNSEELKQITNDVRLISICTPHASKWKAVDIFQSQAKFFHFNKDLKTSKIPEIIVQESL